MALPQIVYVQENAPEGDDDRYLLCDEDQEGACNASLATGTAGERVGIYELKRVVKLTATTTVSEKEVPNANANRQRRRSNSR